MQASWFSRQGSERANNSDAAAVVQLEHTILAVLVDGAEKGPNGAELARHWASVATQVLRHVPGQSPPDIVKGLQKEQQGLRHTFLHDIASYCMIALDLKTLDLKVWHCGDCLVGVHYEEEIRWLTTPHSLSMQPGLSPPGSNGEHLERQQCLTRCLNAKRFVAPEHRMLNLNLEQGKTLLLATDGYWQEHLDKGTPIERLYDDASLLSLPIEVKYLGRINQLSDTDNLNELIHERP